MRAKITAYAVETHSPRFWSKQNFAASFAGVKTLKGEKKTRFPAERGARKRLLYICEGIKSINNIADSEWKFCSQAFVPYFNVWTPLGLVMGACNVCRQWLKAHGKITLTSRPSAFYSQLWAAAASGFHKPNSFFPLPYFSFHLYAQHLFLLEMRSLFSLCWIERDAAAAAGWSAPVGCSPLIYDSACHLLLFDFSRPDRMHTPWAPHIENVFTASTSGGINPSAFINIFI